MSLARARIAELLEAALADAPAPPAPPVRARELGRDTQKRARRRAAQDRRGRRADALERLEARASRAASAAGEAYRPIPRIPPRVWALCSAVTRDTSGRTARTALSTLPMELRHCATRELGATARDLATRYRVALLVGLNALARPTRSRRRPARVVEGYARGAVAALVRNPATGQRLSVSRVFGRAFNAQPLVPWLHERGLLRREQPGLGARGVVRGPSGWALGLYYLDGPSCDLEAPPRSSSRTRLSSGPTLLEELLLRPPD